MWGHPETQSALLHARHRVVRVFTDCRHIGREGPNYWVHRNPQQCAIQHHTRKVYLRLF